MSDSKKGPEDEPDREPAADEALARESEADDEAADADADESADADGDESAGANADESAGANADERSDGDEDDEDQDENDEDAPVAAKPAKPAEPVKSRSALSSMVGILGFVAALGGGFFVGQWLKNDDDGFATAPADARRFKVALRGDEPQKGPDDALVTIIEFADYQCPYCEKAMGPLEEVLEDYAPDVRLIYKHFPLQMHPAAGPAARAAWAAHQQGKFWEVHRFLFEQKARLDGFANKGQELGLDVGKLQADMVSKEAIAAVDDDFKSGGKVGVTGTPHFFVNGHRYKGALDESKWRAILDDEIEAAKAIESQVGRAGVYGKLMEGAIEQAAPDAVAGPRREGEPDPGVSYQVPVGQGRPTLGPDDALVTVVVFSDFQCPFCSKLAPVMHELVETHGARVVFRQMPLSMHPQAAAAAKASLAAHRQGKFWEMHDALFRRQREIAGAAGDGFASFVSELGLDAEKFAQDLADPELDTMIAEDQALARRMGVSGTPASFVNGRFVRGAADGSTFGPLIDAQKAEAQALVDAGTPAASVYEELMKKATPHPGGKKSGA